MSVYHDRPGKGSGKAKNFFSHERPPHVGRYFTIKNAAKPSANPANRAAFNGSIPESLPGFGVCAWLGLATLKTRKSWSPPAMLRIGPRRTANDGSAWSPALRPLPKPKPPSPRPNGLWAGGPLLAGKDPSPVPPMQPAPRDDVAVIIEKWESLAHTGDSTQPMRSDDLIDKDKMVALHRGKVDGFPEFV